MYKCKINELFGLLAPGLTLLLLFLGIIHHLLTSPRCWTLSSQCNLWICVMPTLIFFHIQQRQIALKREMFSFFSPDLSSTSCNHVIWISNANKLYHCLQVSECRACSLQHYSLLSPAFRVSSATVMPFSFKLNNDNGESSEQATWELELLWRSEPTRWTQFYLILFIYKLLLLLSSCSVREMY